MRLIACASVIAASILPATLWAAGEQPQEKQAAKPAAQNAASPPLDREKLEKQLAEKLTGSVLVGSYTTDGQDFGELKTDRYELKRVEKIEGDLWHFHARIKYGEVDAVLPVPITILWAGDTPMITMTNTMVPGLGTFTVRLMFYGDRYAGTWQHDEVGGHMFGKIEKARPEEESGDESK